MLLSLVLSSSPLLPFLPFLSFPSLHRFLLSWRFCRISILNISLTGFQVRYAIAFTEPKELRVLFPLLEDYLLPKTAYSHIGKEAKQYRVLTLQPITHPQGSYPVANQSNLKFLLFPHVCI